MIEFITSVNTAVNSFIWGVPAMICIIGVGLFLSLRTRFIQIRRFPYAIRTTLGRMFSKKDASEGAITPFQAVCTALAATVGTGNIAGVAGAIAIGGPGAVFWMWISAFLGMCTKFSEVTLAVHFRETNPDGDLAGGPMFFPFSVSLLYSEPEMPLRSTPSQRLSGLPSQATASCLTLLSVPLIWLWASFWLPLSLWCSLAASSASEV